MPAGSSGSDEQTPGPVPQSDEVESSAGTLSAVIKGSDGKPVGNATVTCTADGYSFRSVTDSSGTVTITGLPYGAYDCEAVAPGGAVSIPFTITVDGGTAEAAVPQVQVPVDGSTAGSTSGGSGAGTLPSTGSDATPLIAIASCFVLLGGTLTAARRRPARR
jgi:LPXTG-motif cell wall-anchored protein